MGEENDGPVRLFRPNVANDVLISHTHGEVPFVEQRDGFIEVLAAPLQSHIKVKLPTLRAERNFHRRLRTRTRIRRRPNRSATHWTDSLCAKDCARCRSPNTSSAQPHTLQPQRGNPL